MFVLFNAYFYNTARDFLEAILQEIFQDFLEAILQENLNYSPALSVVYKILPQILPQLQSYRCLLTISLDPSFLHFFDDLWWWWWWWWWCGGGGECCSAKCSLQHTGRCLRGDVPPSEARKFCIFETGIVQFGESHPFPGSASPQNAMLPFPTEGRILPPSKCKISTNPSYKLFFVSFFFHYYM